MWLLVLVILIALMIGISWALTLLAKGFSSAQPSETGEFDTVRKIYKNDPAQYVKEEYRANLTQKDLDRIRDACKWRLDW